MAARPRSASHIILAAIILARSDGWMQPFELLIYDGPGRVGRS